MDHFNPPRDNLVGFSYAFFWVGHTGRTVTIAAIATLFALMQATGKVNWNELFGRNSTAGAGAMSAYREAETGKSSPIRSDRSDSDLPETPIGS